MYNYLFNPERIDKIKLSSADQLKFRTFWTNNRI